MTKRIVDVAAGHGLLAWALLLLSDEEERNNNSLAKESCQPLTYLVEIIATSEATHHRSNMYPARLGYSIPSSVSYSCPISLSYQQTPWP